MNFNWEASQIYATDETPFWQDMVETITVTKKENQDVFKSTGHDHEKARVSVCLTVRIDGQKMKPFIVFKGAKREVSQLNDEFSGKCFVASSENGGWIPGGCTKHVQAPDVSWNKPFRAKVSEEYD